MGRNATKKPARKNGTGPEGPEKKSRLEGTGPFKDEEPQLQRIPPRLVRIKRAHDRKIRELSKRLNDGPVEAANKKLEKANKAHRAAVVAYEDARDDEHIRTGLDPEKTEPGLRAPGDVRRLRELGREAQTSKESLERLVQRTERELSDSQEARVLDEAQAALRRWLELFYDGFGTSPANVDWEKETIERRASYDALVEDCPEALLEMPPAIGSEG